MEKKGNRRYSGRLAAEKAARDDPPPSTKSPKDRVLCAIWVEHEHVTPIIQIFEDKFVDVKRDHDNRPLTLIGFEVCPTAATPRGPVYSRSERDSAEEIVLFYSDNIRRETEISDYFAWCRSIMKYDPQKRVFWLGAVHKVSLESWICGETRMKDFSWRILHPRDHGRFHQASEDSIKQNDDVGAAVELLLAPQAGSH